jgi:Rieske 2Fe-2S family protein
MDESLIKNVESKAQVAKRPIKEARHLPGEIYASEEILRLERDRIFMCEWLCVGRVEEIEHPGDFFAVRVAEEPALILRDLQGEIRAFSNICAHRGVEVVSGTGNAKTFSCPYHGWTYGLDGRLVSAPHMRDWAANFDIGNCRLPPIRLDVWAGWIFITFSDDPSPLHEVLAPYAAALGFLRLEDCRLGGKTIETLNCNWKLVVENLVDLYHVHVLHRNSFGKGRRPVDYLKDSADLIGFYEAPPMVDGNKSLFGNMPWLEDKPERFACMAHIDPNMQLFGRSDAVHVFTIWPITPSKTQIVIYDLFPAMRAADPEFAAKAQRYQAYWRLVVGEDRSMIESLQRVMTSRRFSPGPMSSLEHGVHTLINRYLDRVLPPAAASGR